MKIYNGEGLILGRLASHVAKDTLLGEEVVVVNCDKVIISGRKANTKAWHLQRRNRGGYPLKSQTHSRLPERFVRRTIRGMLPWKQSRGREAFKRVMCYRDLPLQFAGKELITLPKDSKQKLPTLAMSTVGDVCRSVGGKA